MHFPAVENDLKFDFFIFNFVNDLQFLLNWHIYNQPTKEVIVSTAK